MQGFYQTRPESLPSVYHSPMVSFFYRVNESVKPLMQGFYQTRPESLPSVYHSPMVSFFYRVNESVKPLISSNVSWRHVSVQKMEINSSLSSQARSYW